MRAKAEMFTGLCHVHTSLLLHFWDILDPGFDVETSQIQIREGARED